MAKPRSLLVLLLAATLALGGPAPSPAAPAPREYDIKAAFLFNFASFVEWPAAAFPDATAPFVIGVIGDDPFGRILDEIVAGEQVNGHRLIVRRLALPHLKEGGVCHILFISSSEARRLRPILRQVGGRPILTVSDVPQFIDAGGAIGFTTEGRVRLVINPVALRAARLGVSSKLLRLAEVVEKEIPPP